MRVSDAEREAAAAEREERFMRAAMLYGAARFPVIATPMRAHALERQIVCFERAARDLSCHFERRQVALSGGRSIPIHLYAPTDTGREPLVLFSGGVDTGKMEMHRLALALAKVGRFRVAAMDMPGNAESGTLRADCEDIYLELLAILAPTGPKAAFGASFGGHWAAKLALLGAVDAAIDLGGPVVVFDSASKFVNSLPNGMVGILSNALGLSAMPNEAEVDAVLQPFSLRRQGLFERKARVPMLVINGDHDQYVPQEDTILFARYPENRVWLMRGMTHCAPEGWSRIIPSMIAWLRLHLYGETTATRLIFTLAQGLLPARDVVNASAATPR